MRGQISKVGDTNVSQNGYHYTRTKDKWRLTHHIIAEGKLGRALGEDEQVYFIDKDKTNLKPENIGVRSKSKSAGHKRLAMLEARRDELNAQIQTLKQDLGIDSV